MDVLSAIGDGLANAGRMAWEVWWALVLGFALSGVVQAYIPRHRLERALGGRGPRELGLVLWLLIGWRFTLAEFAGGLLLIALLWLGLRLFVPRKLEEEARAHAAAASAGHVHPTATDVALNFRADIQMLWKEIVAGFLIAGYVSVLPKGFFNGLFITHAWAPLRVVENVL